jgi:hypothetical protein
MRVVQIKPIQGLLWGGGVKAVKNSSSGHWDRHTIYAPADGSPTQRAQWAATETTAPSRPSCLHLTWLYGNLVLSWGGWTHGNHTVTGPSCTVVIQHLPTHEVQHVFDNAGHMGTGVVIQHNDTPHEDARMLCLDGGTKVWQGSTIQLCTDGDVRVRKCQHEQSTDLGQTKMSRLQWLKQRPKEFFAGGIHQLVHQLPWGLFLTASTPLPRTIFEQVSFEQAS